MSEKSTPSVLGLFFEWALVAVVVCWPPKLGDDDDSEDVVKEVEVVVMEAVALLGGIENEFANGRRAKHSKRRGIPTMVQKVM